MGRSKNILVLMAALSLTLGSTMTSFAGWQSDANGYWWQNDDGTWPANTWQWLDGNGDGIAECYYFGPDGYMLSNTTTPDGYTVNADGAWTIDNFTQIKMVETTNKVDISNISEPQTGYNEYGVSLAVADMLENTMEENAAIYGEVSRYERGSDTYIKYNNGITIDYFHNEPSDATAHIPTLILKDLDDSFTEENTAQDRLNNMKENGYTDSYCDSVVAIAHVSKYQVQWYGNWTGNVIKIAIMIDYR